MAHVSRSDSPKWLNYILDNLNPQTELKLNKKENWTAWFEGTRYVSFKYNLRLRSV